MSINHGGRSNIYRGKSNINRGKSNIYVGESNINRGKSNIDVGRSIIDGGVSNIDVVRSINDVVSLLVHDTASNVNNVCFQIVFSSGIKDYIGEVKGWIKNL